MPPRNALEKIEKWRNAVLEFNWDEGHIRQEPEWSEMRAYLPDEFVDQIESGIRMRTKITSGREHPSDKQRILDKLAELEKEWSRRDRRNIIRTAKTESTSAVAPILVSVAILVGVVVASRQIFSTEIAVPVGLVLAGVAPRVVDVVAERLPKLQGRLKERLPQFQFPEQEDFRFWSGAAAILILQSANFPLQFIAGLLATLGIDPQPPVNPLWLIPLILLEVIGFLLAGYVIGRIDPQRTVKNVAVGMYVLILIALWTSPRTVDPAWWAEQFGMGYPFEAGSLTASLVGVGAVLIGVGIDAALAVWGATWGARHANHTEYQ